MKNDNPIFKNITNVLMLIAISIILYVVLTPPKQPIKYLEDEIKRLDSTNIVLNVKYDSLNIENKKIVHEKETVIKKEIYEKEIVKSYNDSASVVFFIEYTNEYLRTNTTSTNNN